jgi:hypothetical protein
MIEAICVPILFIALAINIPTFMAYMFGLQFEIKDKNCPQDVKDVKRNILLTKVIQGFNVVVMLALIIILSIV